MKAMMTGATGFIGSHLIDRLLADGHEVTALVRSSDAASSLDARGVKVVRGSVEDIDALCRAAEGREVVFHLARAKAHGVRPMSEVLRVNVEGTRNVVRAAAAVGVPRLVHCSSTAVYGSRTGKLPVREDAVLRPESAYPRSKAQAEGIVAAECGTRVAPVIARITAVLGPRCNSWLSLFRSAASGTLRLVGDGSSLHHPADVSDIVEGLLLCGSVREAAGRTYNLAGQGPVAIRELAEMMAFAVGKRVQRQRSIPSFLAESYLVLGRVAGSLAGIGLPRLDSVVFLSSDRQFDMSRARDELGYVPQVNLRVAVQRTADWYRAEGLI